jgi:hypothetical protein
MTYIIHTSLYQTMRKSNKRVECNFLSDDLYSYSQGGLHAIMKRPHEQNLYSTFLVIIQRNAIRL